MSWVRRHGGGVGVGRSNHTGLTVVADGSGPAERKIRREFWTDPALGVARYTDAGCEEAAEKARGRGPRPGCHSFPVNSRRGLAIRSAYAVAPPRPKPGYCGGRA
ncbi:hypothetical protein ABZ027_04380 [Streptomyces sp. NPDC006332]|uniref:hypothetical protein n=1 Tax=Streptomyces sp. NPDC006332 TaxID=3155456 RepID=UPI0033BD3D41